MYVLCFNNLIEEIHSWSVWKYQYLAFLIYNCAQIAICRVLATAVELQEMNWFSIDFKATLMSWQQTIIHKHIAVLAWCVSPKSKASHNLNISTAKYFHRNKQIKKLYCYYNTERVTCRCIKRSYDKWSNSYSIAPVAQQPTFNCWSVFHSVAL